MKTLSYIKRFYKRDFLKIEIKNQRLKIKLTKDLKDFFKEYNIKNESDLWDNYDNFKSFILGDLISYCPDNDMLFPCSYGMTNAPLIGIGGADLSSESIPDVVFAYEDYAIKDWVEELLINKYVYFTSFIDNSDVIAENGSNFVNDWE